MGAGRGWDVPAHESGDTEFKWYRVAGNRVLQLVVLDDAPTWYRGHYHNKRMVPCFGEGCKLCAEGIGAQLRFVVAVADLSGHRPGLFEMGDSVARDVRDLAIQRGGMKGMVIEATKYSFSRQSRTIITLMSKELGPWWRELDAPDPMTALKATWAKQGHELSDVEEHEAIPVGIPKFKIPHRTS